MNYKIAIGLVLYIYTHTHTHAVYVYNANAHIRIYIYITLYYTNRRVVCSCGREDCSFRTSRGVLIVFSTEAEQTRLNT